MREHIFTVQEAADYLKVRPETIRRLLSHGRLPGNKIGRAWRIPEGALLHYLRGGVETGADHNAMDTPVWID